MSIHGSVSAETTVDKLDNTGDTDAKIDVAISGLSETSTVGCNVHVIKKLRR